MARDKRKVWTQEEIEARKLAKDSSVNIPLPTFYTEENKNQLNQSNP